jgi:hypothetical protein
MALEANARNPGPKVTGKGWRKLYLAAGHSKPARRQPLNPYCWRSWHKVRYISGPSTLCLSHICSPLMSMLSHFFHPSSPRHEWAHIKVDMIYSTKLAPASSLDHVLFLRRLSDLAEKYHERLCLRLYLTDGSTTR